MSISEKDGDKYQYVCGFCEYKNPRLFKSSHYVWSCPKCGSSLIHITPVRKDKEYK
jgi:ribosomal protein L37AE/L43A